MKRIPERFRKPEEVKLPYIERAWRRIIQKNENLFVQNYVIDSCMLNDNKREEEIVFSLTSFPARIDSVYKTIKSLMLQTCKADKIILWLAKEQFPDKALPEPLTKLEKFGLTIEFCDLNIGSHKKYFYAMQQYPDSIVITFDDDIIYGENVVERIIDCHNKYPDCIVTDSAKYITFDEQGRVNQYSKWKAVSSVGVDSPSMRIMAMTGSGCLYPPHCMPKETFDIELINNLAFTADDIWMKYNEVISGIKVIKTYKRHRIFILSENSQSENLGIINCVDGGNDAVIKKLEEYNPEFMRLIKN